LKLLIVGDIHSKKANLEVVDQVLTKCRKLAIKCDKTIFLGDMNDGKANLRSETVRQFKRHFKNWPNPIIILIGNHDLENPMNPEGEHSLEFLREFENIQIMDKPIWYTHEHTGRTDDPKFLFIPYYPEERFLEAYSESREERFTSDLYQEPQLLFLHQDMDFAKYSNGVQCHSNIRANMFSKHQRVFVGHIHLPQEFKNIVYVGTPYTESFKESDENKSVVIYDTETDKVMRVPLGVRQHVTYTYTINALDDLKGVKVDLRKQIKPNQIVRVIINVPEEIETKIKRSLFKDLNVNTLKTKKIATTDRVLKVTESMTNLEQMEFYINQLELNEEVLKPVLKINRSILEGIK